MTAPGQPEGGANQHHGSAHTEPAAHAQGQQEPIQFGQPHPPQQYGQPQSPPQYGQQQAPPQYGQPQAPHQYAPPPAPTKPKKPIYKRVWFWILAVIVLIILINAISGGGDDDPQGAPATTTAAQGDDTGSSSPAAEEDPTEEATTTEVAEEVAAIGDPVAIDDWSVTVVSVGEPTETVGSDFLHTTAQGEFIPVHITATNNADQAEYFFADNFVLLDSEGREFSYSSDATIYGASEGAVSILDEINPGNTIEGTLYYDVPEGATIVSMQVSGGFFTEPVVIELD